MANGRRSSRSAVTPIQPAPVRTPASAVMGTPTEPERGGERPISPRDKGGTKGADTRSVGQRRHGTQKTKEYHEQLRRDKDDAARVAMEFLDKLGELPAVRADKTRFGADDVRWAAIKQLLKQLPVPPRRPSPRYCKSSGSSTARPTTKASTSELLSVSSRLRLKTRGANGSIDLSE